MLKITRWVLDEKTGNHFGRREPYTVDESLLSYTNYLKGAGYKELGAYDDFDKVMAIPSPSVYGRSLFVGISVV